MGERLMFIPVLATLALQGFGGERDYILTEKEALFMMPPEVVCSSEVRQMEWSADSKLLAVVRTSLGITKQVLRDLAAGKKPTPPKRELQLIIWNPETSIGRVAFTADGDESRVQRLAWMAGSQRLLMELATGSKVEHWLLSNKGRQKLNFPEGASVDVSPTAPIGSALWSGATPRNFALRFFDAEGHLGPELSYSGGMPQWIGGQLVTAQRQDEKTFAWYEVDQSTGSEKKLPGRPGEAEREPRLDVVRASGTAKLDDKQTFSLRVIAAAPGKAVPGQTQSGLIVADGEQVWIAPDESAIAYTSQGVAFVRQLIAMPRELFFQAKLAAERTAVLSKAKQVATAFALFATDNDDMFPENSGWQDKLFPYLKNRGLMDGFNYTFKGGPIPKEADPRTFVIGFLSGPGGRAVVYLDTHVKWEKDP